MLSRNIVISNTNLKVHIFPSLCVIQFFSVHAQYFGKPYAHHTMVFYTNQIAWYGETSMLLLDSTWSMLHLGSNHFACMQSGHYATLLSFYLFFYYY